MLGRYSRVTVAGVVILTGALALALERQAGNLPRPRAADAPATDFSEARATPTLEALAERIGYRVSGTEGQRAAAKLLEAALRGIPGLEIQRQEAHGEGDPSGWGVTLEYQVTNVLARLPGDSTEAVLVSAHYDSPPESPGAADNALGVAAALEIARALAAGPRLARTVIFNFNDGEEAGSVGSHAFLSHPWMKDVRTFVNLDAAGDAGRSLLFEAGPAHAGLVEAYAKAAPYPFGTIVAQDIFQSGVVPSGTDFSVYAAHAPLAGLDLALFEDGYAYHTALDRLSRVTPGSLQHLGSNTLAFVRALAGARGPEQDTTSGAVFFDLWGRWMVACSEPVARGVSAASLALFTATLVVLLRRKQMSLRRLGFALGVSLLGGLAGLALALACAEVVGGVLGRSMGWFARPSLAVLAYGAAAHLGAVLVHHRAAAWEAKRGGVEQTRGLAVFAANLLVWGILVLVGTLARVGSTYLALAWLLPGSVGLLFAMRWPRRLGLAVWGSSLPGLVLTLSATRVVLALFVPVSGRLALPVPFDLVLAALVAVPVLLLGANALVAWVRVDALGRIALGLTGALGVGMAGLAFAFPYTPARPKRLWVVQQCEDKGCAVWMTGLDGRSLDDVVSGMPQARVAPPLGGRPRVTWATAALPMARPGVLQRVTPLADGSGQQLDLEVASAEAFDIELRVSRAVLLGSALPPATATLSGSELTLRRIAPSGSWRVRLLLKPGASGFVQVRHRFSMRTPELEAVRTSLPPWTSAWTFAAWQQKSHFGSSSSR